MPTTIFVGSCTQDRKSVALAATWYRALFPFQAGGAGWRQLPRIFFSKHTFNDTLSKFSNFCNIYFFFYKEETREVQGCRGHILLVVVVVVVSKAAREMLSLC